MSLRPDSATSLAATAVFSQRWMVTPGSDCKNAEHLADYTGDSFRDLTRIAKINDEMWSELFLLNKKELLAGMDRFADTFAALRGYIEAGDVAAIRQMMRLSTDRRRYFDEHR